MKFGLGYGWLLAGGKAWFSWWSLQFMAREYFSNDLNQASVSIRRTILTDVYRVQSISVARDNTVWERDNTFFLACTLFAWPGRGLVYLVKFKVGLLTEIYMGPRVTFGQWQGLTFQGDWKLVARGISDIACDFFFFFLPRGKVWLSWGDLRLVARGISAIC